MRWDGLRNSFFEGQASPEKAKQQLRIFLLVFLLILIVPLYWLYRQVSSKLENETFYQYRVNAEEVATRINSQLQDLLSKEEARSFDEYNFYNIANSSIPNGNNIKLSPLAEYPVRGSIPGLVGYFQVNPDGSLQTPLLPKAESSPQETQSWGMSSAELAGRISTWDSLYRVLLQSESVPQHEREKSFLEATKRSEATEQSKESRAEAASKDDYRADKMTTEDGAVDNFASTAEASKSSSTYGYGSTFWGLGETRERSSAQVAKSKILSEREIAKIVVGDRVQNLSLKQDQLLDEKSGGLQNAKKVADLNLDSKLLERQSAGKESTGGVGAPPAVSSGTNEFSKSVTRTNRKETVNLPVPESLYKEEIEEGQAGLGASDTLAGRPEPASQQPMEVKAGAVAANAPKVQQVVASPGTPSGGGVKRSIQEQDISELGSQKHASKLTVLTLEGEVEPFQFRILDDLHLLFVRKVWRNNNRFLQGFVVQGEPLFDKLVAEPFRASQVAGISSMIIGYHGVFFRRVNTNSSRFRSSPDGREIVVYRATLAPPFDKMELLIAAPRIPTSPGLIIIRACSYAFVLVLLLGFLTLYRLGVRQIVLAKERSDFVSAVSHELRTPLTSIRMYSEMLRSGWVENEDRKKSYYDYIFHESERLSRLIANVLQFAHLSHNDSPLELKTVAAKQLLMLAKDKVESQVQNAGFELRLHESSEGIDLDQVFVELEEDAFARIVINLVDNALKFSNDAVTKCIEVSVRVESDKVVLTVRDFGPGVPKDQMKKIFQLFYRAGNELHRSTPGTGIGLALVRELAQKMGADVDVRNCQPGAEFSVHFPLLAESGTHV